MPLRLTAALALLIHLSHGSFLLFLLFFSRSTPVLVNSDLRVAPLRKRNRN